jgi:hypothetical protein
MRNRYLVSVVLFLIACCGPVAAAAQQGSYTGPRLERPVARAAEASAVPMSLQPPTLPAPHSL